MSLLVKKFRPLVAILLAAGFAISCEDPGRIGLIINAENGIISTHYEEIILETSVVQFDPRQTSDGQVIQVGQYFNPDFGLVTSISYSQLSLNILIPPQEISQFVSFEADMSFFSLMGDEPISNFKQSIGIYQLAEEIDSATNYTRIDQLATQPTPLAIWEFAPKLIDELQIDSTYVVRLDDNVGRDLFLKLRAGDEIFDSERAFNAYFKGIALLPVQDNSAIFQIQRERIIFRINYNEFNSDGTPVQRSYEMGLNGNGFYHIDSNKSGTPLSGLSPDNTAYIPTDDFRYLQFGTMMAIRVDLTPFFDLTDTLTNVIVNKAELLIGQVKEYPGALPPPAELRFYFTDSTNGWPMLDEVGRIDTSLIGRNFIMLQNELSLLPIPPGGYFAPVSVEIENNRYSVNMSAFFQNLFAGNFFSVSQPFLEQEAQLYIFGRSNVNKPQATESHVLTIPMAVHKDSIRLRIHYTIPTDQDQ